MNIYVGNLSFETSEDDIKKAFERFGQVASSTIIKDKITGKSRGFGFVVMEDKAQGEAAVAGMNGQDLGSRKLKVNEAKPRAQ